jgi:hypothetical protein
LTDPRLICVKDGKELIADNPPEDDLFPEVIR